MRPLVVGYVLRMFPQLSETFIANEILALERLGVDLRITSYRRPREEVRHACVRAIRAPVTYLPDPLWRHPRELLAVQRPWRALEPERHRQALATARAQTRRERSPEPLKRFLQAACLAVHLRVQGVTHMHAHFAHETTRVAMLAAELTGLPYSFTAHARDIYSDDVDFHLLREKVARARFAVTETRFNHAFLRGHIGSDLATKVHVVHNGIDLELFAPDPAVPREDALILAVGRLVEKKGFSTLIAALRLLRERGRRFRCEIVGYGQLRARLEGEIRAAGLTGIVQIVGVRSQEELPAYYRRATLFAMPAVVGQDGNRDSLPTVLLEALACGTPVVASRLTGIPEIVDDGRNGILVASGDPEELSRAVDLLLTDEELRRRFGAAGRAKAEQSFDIRMNARKLRDLLTGRSEVGTSANSVPVL